MKPIAITIQNFLSLTVVPRLYWHHKTSLLQKYHITKKLILKISGVQLSLHETLPTQLQDLFISVSYNYILCFHSINPSVLFTDLSSLNAQMMFLSQNYSQPIHLKDFSGKHTSGCNIIFRNLDVPKSIPFLSTFWNILYYIRLILICVSSDTKPASDTFSLSPTQNNMPLIKLVIYPRQTRYANNLHVRLLCNDYCKEHSEPFQTNIIRKIVNDPVGTHKLHFWNSNQKVVQAAVFARSWYYFEPGGYGNDRYACSRFVMKSILMAYCTYEIMGIITLADVHNISIIPYSKLKTSEYKLIDTSAKGQYILTSMRYANYKDMPYAQQLTFQFSAYISRNAVYCSILGKSNKTIDFSTWLNPFRFEIWIIVFIFLIVLPLPFASMGNSINEYVKSIIYDSLNLFGIFLRVAVPMNTNKRIAYLSIAMLGIFVCGVFENAILSGVLQAPEPTKYLSLASILSRGYKIIWFNKTTFVPPEVEFESLFKLYRLSHLLNSSFHEIKSEMPSVKIKALYLSEKYVTISDNSILTVELPHFENQIKEDSGKEARCFILPESIEHSPSFWEIFTVNRYWLMKSVNRMRESGLTEKWNHWALWALKLHSKLFVQRNHKCDTINLHKFMFPLLIYTVMCGTGVLLFVSECTCI